MGTSLGTLGGNRYRSVHADIYDVKRKIKNIRHTHTHTHRKGEINGPRAPRQVKWPLRFIKHAANPSALLRLPNLGRK